MFSKKYPNIREHYITNATPCKRNIIGATPLSAGKKADQGARNDEIITIMPHSCPIFQLHSFPLIPGKAGPKWIKCRLRQYSFSCPLYSIPFGTPISALALWTPHLSSSQVILQSHQKKTIKQVTSETTTHKRNKTANRFIQATYGFVVNGAKARISSMQTSQPQVLVFPYIR